MGLGVGRERAVVGGLGVHVITSMIRSPSLKGENGGTLGGGEGGRRGGTGGGREGDDVDGGSANGGGTKGGAKGEPDGRVGCLCVGAAGGSKGGGAKSGGSKGRASKGGNIMSGVQWLLVKRPADGLLAGQWEFPHQVTASDPAELPAAPSNVERAGAVESVLRSARLEPGVLGRRQVLRRG